MNIKCINLRIVLVMTGLMGIAYPLAMTGIGLLAFPHQANGSLIRDEGGKVVGSELLAQHVTSAKYFKPRPSAGDYATMPSGASNLSPTSRALLDLVQERKAAIIRENGLPENTAIPSDLLFASGSGLDPHISEAAAKLQAPRIARERNLPVEKVCSLIEANIDRGGICGEDGVNVLKLNVALDRLH